MEKDVFKLRCDKCGEIIGMYKNLSNVLDCGVSSFYFYCVKCELIDSNTIFGKKIMVFTREKENALLTGEGIGIAEGTLAMHRKESIYIVPLSFIRKVVICE